MQPIKQVMARVGGSPVMALVFFRQRHLDKSSRDGKGAPDIFFIIGTFDDAVGWMGWSAVIDIQSIQ